MNSPLPPARWLLLLIPALVLLPVTGHDFTNWDDNCHVTANPRIRDLSLAAIIRLFTVPNTFSYDQPLSELSFALEYRFFKLLPGAYHTTNLLLHSLNCLLIFHLVFRLAGPGPAAAAAALLFALHPLQVETVAWISERKNLLSTAFFLGSLLWYLRARRLGSGASYWLSVFLFLLSLLCKPTAGTLPFILLLGDYLQRRRLDRSLFLDKIPFLLAAIIYFSGITIGLGGSTRGEVFGQAVALPLRNVCKVSYTLVFYLGKLLLPVKLSCLYPQLEDRGAQSPALFFFSPILIAGLIALAGRLAINDRKVGFGSLYFILTLSVTLPVTLIYPWMAADRYCYLPSAGIFFLAGVAYQAMAGKAQRRWKNAGRIAFTALGGAVLIGFALLSRQRASVWKNSGTLWEDAVLRYRGAFLAHNNLGQTLTQAGKLEEAEIQFREAIRIRPGYAGALFNLGWVRAERRDDEESVRYYEQALRYKPGYADAHINLGAALSRLGREDEALRHYREAVRLAPDSALAHFNLGNSLARRKSFPEASYHFQKAKELSSD